MRPRCLFKLSPSTRRAPDQRRLGGAAWLSSSALARAESSVWPWFGSGFQEELHLYPGQLDDVVIVELVGQGIERLAVDHREVGAFHVGDEVAMWPFGDDCHLHPGLAQRGQRLEER